MTIKIYLKIYVADHSLSIHLSFLSTIPWRFPICFVFMENRCIGDFYHIFNFLCHWKCQWSDSFSQILEMKSSKHLKKHCSWSGKLTKHQNYHWSSNVSQCISLIFLGSYALLGFQSSWLDRMEECMDVKQKFIILYNLGLGLNEFIFVSDCLEMELQLALEDSRLLSTVSISCWREVSCPSVAQESSSCEKYYLGRQAISSSILVEGTTFFRIN